MSKQGEFLKTVRKEKGLNQKQLAEELGVSSNLISKWENGECMPDYFLMPKLAETLNIDIQDLLNGERTKKAKKELKPQAKQVPNKNPEQEVFENQDVFQEENFYYQEDQTSLIEEIKSVSAPSNLVCQQCGASQSTMINDQIARCDYCGSVIKVKTVSVNETVNNITNYYNTSHFESNLFYVKGDLEETEFFRETLIYLSMKKNTPVDVLEMSEFEQVSKKYSQFLFANVLFQGFVSASVGYDRDEEYTAYKREHVGNGNYINTPVRKTRVVTDWQPFSSSISSNDVCYTSLGDTNDSDAIVLEMNLEELKKQSSVIPFEMANVNNVNVIQATDSDLDGAIEKGKNYLERNFSFPGNHVKDKNFSISHQVLSKERYIVPTLVSKAKYGEKDYEIRSFCTKYFAMGEVPDDSKNITKEINQKAKAFFVLAIVSAILNIILSTISVSFLQSTIMLIGCVFFFVASLVTFILYMVKHSKFTKSTYKEKQEYKKQALKEYLEKNNLDPLTEDEENIIERGV